MDSRLTARQLRLPALGLIIAALAACSDSQSVTPLAPAVDGPSFELGCRGYIGSGGRSATDCVDGGGPSILGEDDCSGYIGSGGCRGLPLGGTATGRANLPAGPLSE